MAVDVADDVSVISVAPQPVTWVQKEMVVVVVVVSSSSLPSRRNSAKGTRDAGVMVGEAISRLPTTPNEVV